MIELEDSAIDERIEDCVGESKLEILKVLIHHKGIENVNSFEIMCAVFETRFNDDMAIWVYDYLCLSITLL
jgi:hypothetical protein